MKDWTYYHIVQVHRLTSERWFNTYASLWCRIKATMYLFCFYIKFKYREKIT